MHHVGLELHQEVVGDGAAVHLERRQLDAGVLLHGIQHVAALVGDGFQRGADDVVAVGATGQADHGAASIGIPVGGAQAHEGRYQVDAVGIAHLAREVVGVAGIVDDLQLVTQPLDGGAAHEHRTLEGIVHFPFRADGDRGQQAVAGANRLGAGVHQQEAAGAIGVLGHALLEAELAEQGGLLVTGDAGDGDAGAAATGGVAIDLGGGFDLGQHGGGDAQLVQHPLVPLQIADVVEHGARRVGRVGDVHLAVGHLPHQPGVYGAEQQLAVHRLLAGPFHVVQDPLHLGAGEVGVQHQAGVLAHVLFQAAGLELFTDGRGAAALPDDGVVDGLAGGLFPDNGGFTLVGDADGGDLLAVQAALGQHLGEDGGLGRPDLHGVVLDPARFRVVLGEFALGGRDYVGILIEHDGTGGGGTLIQRDDKFLFSRHDVLHVWGDRS
ncbi:hypothetical protein D3C72_774490 [compost metagenome]